MKAITVQQPWAWATLHGKNIENRTSIGTWRPALGSRIAIHAGMRWSIRGAEDARVRALLADGSEDARQAIAKSGVRPSGFALGVLIGTVVLDDIHHAEPGCDPDICQPWGEQSYLEHGGAKRADVVHLVLKDPRPCQPIPCRGALGLWTPPADIAEALKP